MIKMIDKGNSYRQYSNTDENQDDKEYKTVEKITIFKHSENDNNGKDEKVESYPKYCQKCELPGG